VIKKFAQAEDINSRFIMANFLKTPTTAQKQAGSYNAIFNGSGLSSGVYFYRIEAGDFRQVKRMMMVK